MTPKISNNKFAFILFLFFLLLLYVAKAKGQQLKVTRDIGLWTEIELEKKILKDFTACVSQHFRLKENCGSPDDYIAELGLRYAINKKFAIGTNGRYTRNWKFNEPVQNDYRYDFDFLYDTKILSRLKFYYRLKFQKEFYGSGVFNEYLHYYETAFRNRIKIGWKKDDYHRFYTSSEIFRLTKKSREPYYSKYRFWLGDEISLKNGAVDVAFGFEHQLNNENPYTYCIFKLKYKINL